MFARCSPRKIQIQGTKSVNKCLFIKEDRKGINSNIAKQPDLTRELSIFNRAEVSLQRIFFYLTVLYIQFTTDTEVFNEKQKANIHSEHCP